MHWFFVIQPADGTVVLGSPVRKTLGDAVDGLHRVRDASMYFAPNGYVYVSFKSLSATANKALVGAYDTASSSFAWLLQTKFNLAYSDALTYHNFCGSCGNLIVGGSIQWDKKNWTIMLAFLNELDGQGVSFFEINENSDPLYSGLHQRARVVDHLHVDTVSSASTQWLFGSTRSWEDQPEVSGVSDYGQVYLWRVELDTATNSPNLSTLVCVKWQNNEDAANSMRYEAAVIALKPAFDQSGNLHGLVRKTNADIHYFVYDWDVVSPTLTSILISSGNAHPSPAIFRGALSWTENASSVQVYEAYIGGAKNTARLFNVGTQNFETENLSAYSLATIETT